jgi:hypothetical protein
LNAGSFPYYGCGWIKTKDIGIIGPFGGGDVKWEHADYVGRFLAFTTERDTRTSLAKWTYREAREKARFFSDSPNEVNPWSSGWKHIGCDTLYIDE